MSCRLDDTSNKIQARTAFQNYDSVFVRGRRGGCEATGMVRIRTTPSAPVGRVHHSFCKEGIFRTNTLS